MNRGKSLAAPLLLSLMVISCSSESPTEPLPVTREAPTPAALAGTWSAVTSFVPPGEDWSIVRMTLRVEDAGVRGDLTTRDGIRHSVTADMAPSGVVANLVIGELPNHPSCTRIQFSNLVIEKSGAMSALVVDLDGRCPNTLAQKIRFSRE